MAAVAGDTLVAIADQPLRTGHSKGAPHHHVGIKAGVEVVVEKVYVEKKTKVRRLQVSFTDDKDKSHKGWVREDDAKFKYFEFQDGRATAPPEGVPPPAKGKGKGKGKPKTKKQTAAAAAAPEPEPAEPSATEKQAAAEAKARAAKAEQSAAERRAAAEEKARLAKAERLAAAKAADEAREAAEKLRLAPLVLKKGSEIVSLDPLKACEKDKPNSKVILLLPRDTQFTVNDVKLGKDGAQRAKVALPGKKKRWGWVITQEATMEKRVRLTTDAPVVEEVEQPYDISVLDHYDVEDEFAKLDKEREAKREQSMLAKAREHTDAGKQALQQRDYARASAAFANAFALLPDDAEIIALRTEAKNKRHAEELVAEAASCMEHDQSAKAEERYKEALALDPGNEAAAAALAQVGAQVEQLAASIGAADKEKRQKQTFAKLDAIKKQCTREIEQVEDRVGCKNIVGMCRKALALDPDEEYPDRGAFEKINREAFTIAHTLKKVAEAQQEIENGHFTEAIELYDKALVVYTEGLERGFTTQVQRKEQLEDNKKQAEEKLKAQEAAAKAEAAASSVDQLKAKEEEKAKQKRTKIMELKKKAEEQIEAEEYFAAEQTSALALTGRKYAARKASLSAPVLACLCWPILFAT